MPGDCQTGGQTSEGETLPVSPALLGQWKAAIQVVAIKPMP